MAIRIQKALKRWVMYQVNAELDRDVSLRRKDVILTVLAQFARSGDAERYIRPDGHVEWRGTSKFRDWLDEGRHEANEADDAAA